MRSINKIKLADCCKNGSILIMYWSRINPRPWMSGLESPGWWLEFVDLGKRKGLNIVACPFCGTKLPPLHAVDVLNAEDYKELEDVIIGNFEVSISMGYPVMKDECKICKSRDCECKLMYRNDLPSEEWSDHVE